jgi:hypothetical protein
MCRCVHVSVALTAKVVTVPMETGRGRGGGCTLTQSSAGSQTSVVAVRGNKMNPECDAEPGADVGRHAWLTAGAVAVPDGRVENSTPRYAIVVELASGVSRKP